MRREALVLVLAMAIGSVSMVACDKPEPRAAIPELPKGPPKSNVDPSLPKAALGTPTEDERKESTMLVQGDVRNLDYEKKK